MNKKEILNYLKNKQNLYYKEFGIKFVALFGSYARDEEKASSDIDILYEIEKGNKLSIFSYLKLLNKLEKNLNKKVDLVRESSIKPQIKKYIYKDLIYV